MSTWVFEFPNPQAEVTSLLEDIRTLCSDFNFARITLSSETWVIGQRHLQLEFHGDPGPESRRILNEREAFQLPAQPLVQGIAHPGEDLPIIQGHSPELRRRLGLGFSMPDLLGGEGRVRVPDFLIQTTPRSMGPFYSSDLWRVEYQGTFMATEEDGVGFINPRAVRRLRAEEAIRAAEDQLIFQALDQAGPRLEASLGTALPPTPKPRPPVVPVVRVSRFDRELLDLD